MANAELTENSDDGQPTPRKKSIDSKRGIRTPLDGNRKTFEAVQTVERARINTRRKSFGIPNSADAVGLALSGGGIRAATFSLGFLQALSAAGKIPRIDYISTVSGGSYIGSFFGALFVPQSYRGDGQVLPGRPAFDPQHPLESPLGVEGVRRLREAGRYLTPGGTSDAFFGAAVVMRNWAAVHVVIGMVAFSLFWLLGLIDICLADTALAGKGVNAGLLGLLLIAAVAVLGSGSAYWLTRRDWIPGSRIKRAVSNGFFWAMVLLTLYFAAPWYMNGTVDVAKWLPRSGFVSGFIACVAISALVLYAAVEARHGYVESRWLAATATPEQKVEQREKDLRNPQFLIAAEDRVRTRLSAIMSSALMALFCIVGLIGVMVVGEQIMAFIHWLELPKLASLLAGIIPPLLSYLASGRLKQGSGQIGGGWLETHMPTLVAVIGIALLAVWLIVWNILAVVGLAAMADVPLMPVTDNYSLHPEYALLILLILANAVLGMSFSFINLSSLSTFYASRLRRAYIGASSVGRARGSVRTDSPQDAIKLERYHSGMREGKGPIHLINVTIAETITGDSNLVARDRKGKPMHLAPNGIIYEGSRPGTACVGVADDPRFPLQFGEELPLANWVAISGAAVSAAIGSGTSLGTSILATLGNVRLGYWWKQKRSRKRDGLGVTLRDFVQNYLLLELRGAFPGTKRARWYLTDGGHFENTGAYTLLQRKVKLLIICDNGADPSYQMADMVRLISHARTDLGAKIVFLDEAALAAKLGNDPNMLTLIGPYAALAKRGADGLGGPIAALATISYADGTTGTLLLVKPRLTFTEPPELLAYQALTGNRDFPQQTTADQFFDENQWEAYRRLGEIAGEKLFGVATSGATGWKPANMMA